MCVRYNITKDHSLGRTLLDLCMSRESLQYFPKCCEYEFLMLSSYTFKTPNNCALRPAPQLYDEVDNNGIIVDGVFILLLSLVFVLMIDSATMHCCFCYRCCICHSQLVTVATATVTYRYIGLQTAVKQTIYTGGDWKSQQI